MNSNNITYVIACVVMLYVFFPYKSWLNQISSIFPISNDCIVFATVTFLDAGSASVVLLAGLTMGPSVVVSFMVLQKFVCVAIGFSSVVS